MKEVRPEDLVSAVPVKAEVKAMTKREKFLHWAELVRKSPAPQFMLWHRLEYYTEHDKFRAAITPGYLHEVFSLAVSDPVFNQQGLQREGANLLDIEKFFEASCRDEFHAFSCDCGGALDKDQIASRMENIANRGIASAVMSSFTSIFR